MFNRVIFIAFTGYYSKNLFFDKMNIILDKKSVDFLFALPLHNYLIQGYILYYSKLLQKYDVH
jgi:hypothetical protein